MHVPGSVCGSCPAALLLQIGFKVTSKEKVEETSWVALKRGLAVTWPHLLYYLAFFVGQCRLGAGRGCGLGEWCGLTSSSCHCPHTWH